MKLAIALSGLGLLACGGGPDSEDERQMDVESPIVNGYVTTSCTDSQRIKVEEAHDILFDIVYKDFNAFRNCMESAPSIEFSCHEQRNPIKAAESLKLQAYTTVKCVDLAAGINGRAPVSINGSNLTLDDDFLAHSSARRVASVIAHEIMHNRGYRHETNDFGSKYYQNTIPEQIEACVLKYNVPNLQSDARTVTWNEEYCDGPKTGSHTARRGMHACPEGSYMSGVRVDNNEFLCARRGLDTYQTSEEIVRYKGGYAEFGMANCPRGYAMTGFHEAKNQLLCAPLNGNARQIDYSTSRAGMHTCPGGGVMTGIHVGKNRLTCQKVNP
jgi:hypothetical protein